MSDFTTSTITDTGSTMGAVLNAPVQFAHLMTKIFETVNRIKHNKMMDLEIADRHENHEWDKRTAELRGMSGEVSPAIIQEMKEHGIGIEYTGVQNMSQEQFAKFREKCTHNGVAYSAIRDKDTGDMAVYCRQGEAVIVNDITESFITEGRLTKLEEKKQNTINDDTLSAEEKAATLDALDKQGDEIQREAYAKFNDRQTTAGIGDIAAGKENIAGAVDFNRSLNRDVSYLDGMNDRPYYIVDAQDPGKFVEVTETKYTDVTGAEKIGANYAVYNKAVSDAPVMQFSDINREGIDGKTWVTEHWNPAKAEMKEAGSFSDCVYKVDCKERLEAIQAQYTQQNPQLGQNMSNADKAAAIESKFAEGGEYAAKGFTYADGQVRTPAGEPIKDTVISDSIADGKVTPDELMASKAYTAGERINNYREQAALEQQPQTPENTAKMTELKERGDMLEKHSNFLNGATAENGTRDVRAQEQTIEKAEIQPNNPAEKARPVTEKTDAQINAVKAQMQNPSSDALAKLAAKTKSIGTGR